MFTWLVEQKKTFVKKLGTIVQTEIKKSSKKSTKLSKSPTARIKPKKVFVCKTFKSLLFIYFYSAARIKPKKVFLFSIKVCFYRMCFVFLSC